MLDTAAPATRRELSKAERRQRIVEAATSLLRDSGFDAVSVLQIAGRAEVSPATAYNLFQTKAAILQQVFDRDLSRYERLVELAPARDAIDRIFKAVDVAASLYRGDPGFYRAMAQGGRRGDTPRSAISEPRIGFWRRMVAAARAEGRLVPETDERLVGVTLSQIIRGVFSEWAAGVISAERLAQETSYGFALALTAYATGDSPADLAKRLRRLEGALAERPRNQGAGAPIGGDP
ncbi:MAG: TetR/AcrR family transcriptional regulator [Caulobacteraceae bacterium]